MEVDYIIIGAGSAGCVLANALSANPDCHVLLLEAGPTDRNLYVHMPIGVYRAFRDPRLNWNYYSASEPELADRSIFAPRGRLIGGSTSINSMVYMRGHPLDYDRWADECGLPDWRFAHCLPYFKACETYEGGADDWRGDSGPQHVSRGNHENPLFDAFLEAGEQAGQGRSNDLNGFQPEGVARYDATKKNGRRCSAADAHLKPALVRENLQIRTGAEVRALVIEAKRVVGASFTRGGSQVTARARAEVILCGGAINTPKLLMLSGIGPPAHLRERGIEPRVQLPGVGQNLQDHAKIRLQFASKRLFEFHKVENLLRKLGAGMRWVLFRDGIAASNIWEAGGLVRGNDRVEYPNLQYHFGPVGFSVENGNIRVEQAFSLNVDQMRPGSRGQILLNPDDVNAKPTIMFNYLSDPQDMQELVEGMRLARNLVAQPAFDEFRGMELRPGPDAQSDSDIRQVLRRSVETAYHPSGTCSMGDSDHTVVDPEFRVHGIEGLRVVDASVMPRIVSGNLNAPIQMMALRAADYILGRPQLEPIEARFHFQ
tara:strand:- start:4307 stop:5932 length:1626 start_codon:yes stop_codon:yes gene_type:complete